MRSDRERLLDIADAVERIEVQAARGRATFATNEVAQTAVIRWVEVIGAAARGLTEELRQAHPEVPRRQMIAIAAAAAGSFGSGEGGFGAVEEVAPGVGGAVLGDAGGRPRRSRSAR